MLGFRPKTTDLYLGRTRLLKRLPDSEGFVIWLEAPYGYGKSVLASQWAETLENAHWRVLWLSLQGRDLKVALAALLGLSSELLWGSLLDALWGEPTLLVLEEAEKNADVDTLLRDVRGLLLLASRTALSLPELPRLETQGRLIHLQVEQLAFTLDETRDLTQHLSRNLTREAQQDNTVGNRVDDAADVWQRTAGWSLPLHFALLTGEIPEGGTLLEGVRESLSEASWHEALLLSALPYLPIAAATRATLELARSGFTQELATGFRLHPLAAEAVQRSYPADLQGVVKDNLSRLPAPLQAEALARARLYAELAAFTEAHYLLGRDDPGGAVRWDRLCVAQGFAARGPGRLLGIGWAYGALDDPGTGGIHLDAVLTHPQATPDQKLSALGWRMFDLPPTEHQKAAAMMQQAEPLLEQGSPERAGVFLSNAAAFYLKIYAWEGLVALVARALDYLAGSSASATLSAVRQLQAEVQWELGGDLEGLIHATRDNLRVQQEHNAYNVPVNHYDLGVYLALLSSPEAVTHFKAAEAGSAHNLLYATSAQAERAAHQGQPDILTGLVAQAQAWRDTHPDAFDRLHALRARTLRRDGQAAAALESLKGLPGPNAATERALALAALGHADALSELPDPASIKRRRTQLEVQAARFALTGAERDVDTLIGLTRVRERVLPALVPLSALPRDRPELSRAYPLGEALKSGWREAALLRQTEIPPLELRLLGTFRASVLGEDIELTSRHRALLALMALGRSREAIGDALWPDTESKKVQNNLHVQLNLLRKALEPWGFRTYLSESGLSHTRSDLGQLSEALASGDSDAVLRLYREPLAPATDLPELDEARADLRERVLEHLFDAAQEGRETMYLERLLELDPLHEEALQLLLERLIAGGRKREALRRYGLFSQRLKGEMGLEPLPETSRILKP